MDKILLYSTLSSRINPYVKELEIVFRKMGLDTHLGSDDFWNKAGDYDFILFQWPEELFEWRTPSSEELSELTQILTFWSGRSKLIITRHNIEPHENSKDMHYRKLYEIMYAFAHAVVHLGEYSKGQYVSQYSGRRFLGEQKQEVIPHPIYTTIENKIDQEQARTRLRLPKRKKIILVFGKIRNEDEFKLINRAFSKLKHKNCFLLISHFPLPVFRGSVKLRFLIKFLLRYRFNQRRYFGGIPENRIQYFMHAADVLFIPRIDTLNSGNVFLGFTFQKPVVGPNITNIGPILQQTGNSTFEPLDLESVVGAISQSGENTNSPGNYQRMLAENYPSNLEIGELYLRLFKDLNQQTS